MATIRCLSNTFENIQAVLFDKDGTLANVERYLSTLGQARARFVGAQVPGMEGALEESILSAFGQNGREIDPAGLMAVGSRQHNEVAAAAYVAATGIGWIAALDLVNAAFVQAEAALSPKVTQTPPLDGMSQLFATLTLAGVKLGIVSSDMHQEVAAFVDYYQCKEISWYWGVHSNAQSPHLSPPLSSPSLSKTHPDFLEFACEVMAISPAATLVIGDSAADLALARQGAAGFVAMTGGWSCPPVIDFASTEMAIAMIQSLVQIESFK